MPVKQLKGFEKVGIAPGESREVSFRLTPEELYVFDADSDSYFVPAGEYEVLVGGASDALVLSSHFSLEPAEARPDLQVINIRTVPPFPQEGDAVSFVASMLNRGTGPSAAGTPQTVQFWVNNEIVATSEAWLDSIPVGGMAVVSTSDKSTEVPAWTARNGQQSIRAAVDFQDITAETIESNNSSEATLALPGGKARTVGSPGSTNVRSGL
jgi:beta-glucosidase